MFNISSYLEKFKSIGLSETLLKDHLIEAVDALAGVKITRKDITLKNAIAYLAVSPAAKGRIFIKKSAIISKIQEQKGEEKLLDIK